MSQPPNDPPGQPSGEQSGDQPSYGQPTYGSAPVPQSGSEPPRYPDPQPYGDQQYGQQQYGQPAGWSQPTAAQYGSDIRQSEAGYAQMYGEKPRTGMSVAALVLGILAFLLAWFPIGSYFAVVLSILAVVFGIVGVRRRAGKGMAIAGIVLGGISLVASAIMSVIWTFGFIAVSECYDETGGTSGPAFEACIERKAGGN